MCLIDDIRLPRMKLVLGLLTLCCSVSGKDASTTCSEKRRNNCSLCGFIFYVTFEFGSLLKNQLEDAM